MRSYAIHQQSSCSPCADASCATGKKGLGYPQSCPSFWIRSQYNSAVGSQRSRFSEEYHPNGEFSSPSSSARTVSGRDSKYCGPTIAAQKVGRGDPCRTPEKRHYCLPQFDQAHSFRLGLEINRRARETLKSKRLERTQGAKLLIRKHPC